jgi:hypothetical protein
LKENKKKINWQFMASNKNPEAIELMKSNLDIMNWGLISSNPSAIELLEANPDKINSAMFSSNPAIFTYDYDLIKENFKDLGEEIVIKALHPKRMLRLMELYGEDEIYDCYFDEY